MVTSTMNKRGRVPAMSSYCCSDCGRSHKEQKYLWTGKATIPAKAMPRLSPTLAIPMANSLYRSSLCGPEKTHSSG